VRNIKQRSGWSLVAVMHPSKPSIQKPGLFAREPQVPPWPLLEPNVDDVGANTEKCHSNLVRGRAVAYADGGEDDTATSYDVGEAAVVWCPD
jgi:hypothetical protein